MEPIYGPRGEVVAWLKSPNQLLDLRGSVIAWIDRTEVYTLSGSHVGQFVSGFFRDRQGNATAWVRGASGGPMTPIPSIPPIPPIPAIPPIPPIFAIPAIPAIPSFSWSGRSFDRFASGA